MSNTSVPLEAGNAISVKAYVLGALRGQWERASRSTGLSKEELVQIADAFYDRQDAYNKWRWQKQAEFRLANQMELAEEYSIRKCVLCDRRLYDATGSLTCACYADYKIGYLSLMPVDPALLESEWRALGGEWDAQNYRLLGTPEARMYADRDCYANECTDCTRSFYVKVQEVLRISMTLDENPLGSSRYRLRFLCTDCKARRRQQEKAPSRNRKPPHQQPRAQRETPPTEQGDVRTSQTLPRATGGNGGR